MDEKQKLEFRKYMKKLEMSGRNLGKNMSYMDTVERQQTLQDILNSDIPSLKLRMPENNIETNANYTGADKVGELIELVNYLSSLQKGGFGQTLSEVKYSDMPEVDRLKKRKNASPMDGIKSPSFEEYQKILDLEKYDTTLKAIKMLNMYSRGDYDYKLGGTNVPLLREDYLKTDVRKVFGDKSK